MAELSDEKMNAETPRSFEEAAAAAMEVVKRKGIGINKFIYNSYEKEIIKGNQRPPGGWIHGPAHLELFRAGYNRLVRLAGMRGEPSKSVAYVRAARLKGTKKIYLWPVDADAPDAIPVTGSRHSSWINLISLLESNNFVSTGFRERYALKFTESGPDGPAVVLDLGLPLERRSRTQRNRTRTTAPGNERPTAPDHEEQQPHPRP